MRWSAVWVWVWATAAVLFLCMSISECQHAPGKGAPLVAIFLGVVCLVLANAAQRRTDTGSLSRTVKSLAPLAGKTLESIQKKLGPPAIKEQTPDGETLITWRSPHYRVTIAFRDGICTRVAKEEAGSF